MATDLQPDRNAYSSVMEEIKLREKVIRSFVLGERDALFNVTTVETIVLQVRMVLELIPMASLAAHKDLFNTASKKFRNHWHPGKILTELEALNPDFFPVPIEEKPLDTEGIKAVLAESRKEALTREELVRIHGKCGGILHASNPYNRKTDYDKVLKDVNLWMTKVRNLLNVHKIRLLDETQFHLVQMSAGESGRVHMYMFQRVE